MVTWLLRSLLALLVALLLAIVLVATIEPRFDLTDQRDWVGNRLTEIVDHDVRIGGSVQLALGRHAHLAVSDLAVAAPEWAADPLLLEAEEAAAGLDLLALLAGEYRIEGAALRGAVVALETSPDGVHNWSLGPPAPGEPGARAVRLGDLAARDVVIAYRRPDRQALRLRVDRLEQQDDDGMLRLSAGGGLNGLPYAFDGRIGPLHGLTAARDIDLDATARLGDTRLAMRGHFGDPLRLEDVDFTAQVQGPSLSALLDALGIPHEHGGDIDVNLSVTDRDQGFSWRSSGRFGPLGLDTHGVLEHPLTLGGLQVSAWVTGEDLAALGGLFGIGDLPASPYRLTGDLAYGADGLALRQVLFQAGETRVALDGDLPRFPTVDQARARLFVHLPRPDTYGAPLGLAEGLPAPLHVEFAVEPDPDGRSRIAGDLTLGAHRAVIDGLLGAHPVYADSALDFRLSGPSLAELSRPLGVTALPDASYRFAGSTGSTSAGQFSLELSEGQAGSVSVGLAGVLGSAPEWRDANLGLRIAGPSFAAAFAGEWTSRLPSAPFELSGRLLGGREAPAIGNLAARLGSARLDTTGRIGLGAGLEESETRFLLQVPEPRTLLTMTLPGGWTQRPLRASGQLHGRPEGLALREVSLESGELTARLDATLPPGGRLDDGLVIAYEAAGPDLAAELPGAAPYRPPQGAFRTAARLRTAPGELVVESFALEVDSARLAATGRLALDARRDRSELQLRARGARLADLGGIGDMPLPERPFAARAALVQTDRHLEIDGLVLELDGGTLSGAVTIERTARPRVEARLQARGIGFPLAGAGEPAEQDADAGATTRLIPDTALPTPWLQGVDGVLDLAGTDLEIGDPVFVDRVLVRRIETSARLDDGTLTVDTLLLEGDRGTFAGSATLSRAEQDTVLQLELQGEDVRYGLLADVAGRERPPAHDLRLALSGRGRTWRELARSLEGSLRTVGGRGATDNVALERRLQGFGAQLLETLNPFARDDPRSVIECTAASLRATAGKLYVEPGVVVRTDKIDMGAVGVVDLADETLDLRIISAPRKGLGLGAASLVEPFVKIGGTLAAPRLEPDPGRALLSGTAAAATGGLSLVATGLLERLGTAANPCAALLAKAEAENADAGPAVDAETDSPSSVFPFADD